MSRQSRQNESQKAKRAARGLGETRGRKPWKCEKCHGAERWKDNEGKRHCHTCQPKTRDRGRPKKKE